MKIEKGMIVSVDDVWYVVVMAVYDKEHKTTYLYCICDHANNIHVWPVNNVHSYMSLKEIGNLDWEDVGRVMYDLQDREIPYQVITEVLAGRHDDRFTQSQ